MNIRGVAIDDTFAEAFAMAATAITITGPTRRWAMNAATSMTGFATSIIGCGCEAGIDRELRLSETPDRRPGVRVIILSMSPQELQKQLANRLGYLCFGVAIVTFVIGFIVSFNATVSAIVVTSMIVGSALLAPAIVLGYAVKAAEREDRERGL